MTQKLSPNNASYKKKPVLNKKEQVFALIFRDLSLSTRTETDRAISQSKIVMLLYLGIDLGFSFSLTDKGYESPELISTLESPLYFLSHLHLPKDARLKPGASKHIDRIQKLDTLLSKQFLNRIDAFRIAAFFLYEYQQRKTLDGIKEDAVLKFPNAGEKLISCVLIILKKEQWFVYPTKFAESSTKNEKKNQSLRIAGFTQDSIVDGPGIRSVIWVQGCSHNCMGCHNPQTHDPEGGMETSIEPLKEMLEKNKFHSGLTLSGGEPMDQAEALTSMLQKMNPRPNVWCYTGYRFEECLKDARKKSFLQYIDVLVDGRFMKDKMPGGKWRGSSNQRLIDVPKSLKEGKTVEIVE